MALYYWEDMNARGAISYLHIPRIRHDCFLHLVSHIQKTQLPRILLLPTKMDDSHMPSSSRIQLK